MIRPRDDISIDGQPAAAEVTAPPAPPEPWDIESLPPELEYFQRSEAYQIEISGFQGPMDLLLYLIQKDEIDIYDIPISRITDAFIKHIEIMKMISLDQAGEFMAMAATLLVIKMKLLMPRHHEEEEETEEDPRAELVRRLLEYKRFKEAARQLQICEQKRAQYHTRVTRYPFVDHLDLEPELRIEMFDLLSALAGILDRVQATPVHMVVRESFTVLEKIDLILEGLTNQEMLRFEDCFADDTIKMEVIVTFIAILELVKRGRVVAFQAEPLGPIWLKVGSEAEAVVMEEREAAS